MYVRALSLSLLLAAFAAPAWAAPPPPLHELRLALASYDLEDGGTVQVLERIHARLPAATGLEREELRFLRAAVAADLMLIAALRDDAELRDEVAVALDTESVQLPALLDAELNAARGTYRMPAQQVRTALEELARRDGAPGAAEGTHGRVLRLLAVRRALDGGGDAIAALEPFGQDPCAEPKAPCKGVYANLEPRARRAATGLAAAAADVARLERTARQGDPLAAALTPELSRISAELQAVELRPVPRLAADLDIATAGGAAPLVAELVLIVGERSVRYGFAPRLGLAEDGAVRAVASAQPALPALAELELPDSFRPYMSPLAPVTELIERAMKDNPNLTIAVGAEGDTRAHLLGRVLLSMRRAGNAQTWLLARSERGFARAVDVRLVSKREGKQLKDAPLRLRVRLGGYSLHVGDDFEDIPRVRDDHGLHFDVDTLQARLARQQVREADVSFMADVASESLTAALFRVARRSDAVRLVFP